MSTTLLCTVGGSPEPIMTAIRHHKPARIVFVCSQDAPTGRKGSYTQVEGEQGTPGILARAGYEGRWSIEQVPADDPQRVVECLMRPISEALREGKVVSDYTGGTKSMSTGLFLASAMKGVQIYLVTGTRSDLDRVTSGTEAVKLIRLDDVEARWLLEDANRAWARWHYNAADQILTASELATAELEAARVLSRGFAKWDGFEHAVAYELLRPYAKRLPRWVMPTLGLLRQEQPSQRSEAWCIWDLRQMARRRADLQRYDAAVLLLYRCFEWIAQWSLRWHHELRTDDVDLDRFHQVSDLTKKSARGTLVLSSEDAWKAVQRLGGPLAEIAAATAKRRVDIAGLRNLSVFAHGFRPVDSADFQKAQDFFATVEHAYLEAANKGTAPFPQLPTEIPGLRP